MIQRDGANAQVPGVQQQVPKRRLSFAVKNAYFFRSLQDWTEMLKLNIVRWEFIPLMYDPKFDKESFLRCLLHSESNLCSMHDMIICLICMYATCTL